MTTRVIDMTPNWIDILPAMLETARNGTDQSAIRNIEREFESMARGADSAIAAHKAKKRADLNIDESMTNLFNALDSLSARVLEIANAEADRPAEDRSLVLIRNLVTLSGELDTLGTKAKQGYEGVL